EAGYSTTRTGPAATLYTNLLMTGTPDALSRLSGEVHGSVQAVIVDDSRYIRQAVLGRPRQAPHDGRDRGHRRARERAGRRWPMRNVNPSHRARLSADQHRRVCYVRLDHSSPSRSRSKDCAEAPTIVKCCL